MNTLSKGAKSKICASCGYVKPIEDFILGSIDAKCGKKESSICKNCRQQDISTWKPGKTKEEVKQKEPVKKLTEKSKDRYKRVDDQKSKFEQTKGKGKVGLFQ